MKLLLPTNYTLLDTNIPASEAMAFTNRIYGQGEIVAFDKYVYKKLEADEVFEAFNNRKYYTEGNNVTHSNLNYVCILSTKNPIPSSDARFTVQIVHAWYNSTNYTAGQLVSFNGKTYICLKPHLSSPTGTYLPWVYGQSSAYYAGACSYNGRYYKNTATFRANTIASFAVPNSNHYYTWEGKRYYIWEDVTSIVYIPSIAGEFWQEVTYYDWNETLFYGVGDIVLYNAQFYKCITAITSLVPSSDTTHWSVVVSKIPSSSESWERIETLNRFKMFDQFLNTVTTNNGNIEVLLHAPSTQALFLGNIYADSVEIEVLDLNENIIESFESSLFNPISDWQDYFFGDWITERKNNVLFERSTLTMEVTYRIKLIGDVCACGILTIGKSSFIGNTQYEIQDEAIDYSSVVTDTATGETYLFQGNEAPLLSIDLYVNTSMVDSVKKKLKDARGLPVIFYDALETTKVYGFIKKRSTLISGPVKTVITLDIQGLI